MKEISFILPKNDNDGCPVVDAQFYAEKQLLKYFGAFTRQDVHGFWQCGDTVFEDKSHEYRVAISTRIDAKIFRSIALNSGKKAKQLAVYIKDQQGSHIIPISANDNFDIEEVAI